MTRQQAKIEAERDLEKPIIQLLTDIHEEINDDDRTIEENIAHAQKRFYSLVANIAASNEKLSNRVYILTIITVLFAALQVLPIVFRLVSLLFSVKG